MSDPALGIQDFFRSRYGREAIYLPSGRLALYLAFREWLRPADRILISPINDDVVFFTVLAAGLRPVIGPVDPATGNLAPEAVDESVWPGLRAVMTTNLYGIPDRMDLLESRCRRHGLLLIEDACQALDTRFGGRRIGQISDVAVFSLTKHVRGVGGVLAFTETGRGVSLTGRTRSEVARRRGGRSTRDHALLLLREAADLTGTRSILAGLRRRIHAAPSERDGHRMPYDTKEVTGAGAAGAGLDRFDRWVRVDNPMYRLAPLRREMRRTLTELERFEENRRRRLEGTARLLSLGLTPSSVRLPGDGALFRVPLFVERRERILAYFAERGLRLDYVYDPPLDRYASEELADRLPSPGAARLWSRDVLPVDPLQADRFLSLLKRSPGLLSPAASDGG